MPNIKKVFRVESSENSQAAAKAAAISVLKKDGLVIFPTETCYGVAADATNPVAVKKLLEYKDRPEGKAISIAVTDQKMAEEYVELNGQAKTLYQKFLPGPVTIISQSKGKVAKALESESGTLGIRIPDYPFILELIRQYGKPITATSANRSGAKTPYSIADITENQSKKRLKLVDLALDAGELEHNPPSTVIDTTLENMVIYRTGTVKLGKEILRRQTKNEAETSAAGKSILESELGKLGQETILILLHGNMGAGKTYLTKGIAKGLGIKTEISSPTYTYATEYEWGKDLKMIHADVWRLAREDDFTLLEPEAWFAKPNVVVIEWADRISNVLQELLASLEAKRQEKNAAMPASPPIRVLNIELEVLSDTERLITARS